MYKKDWFLFLKFINHFQRNKIHFTTTNAERYKNDLK